MSKFLQLVESSNPENIGNPKWDLIDFLKSKGVPVSIVRNTDMLYIDTGEKVVAVTIAETEEEAESINASTGDYGIDDEVEKLGTKAATGLKGMGAKMFGTSAQQAKTAMKQRQGLAKQAVNAYKQGTERIRKGLQQVKNNSITPTY